AWLAVAAIYFGGIRVHSLQGDLPFTASAAALRGDAAGALQFAARAPMACALLGLALAKTLRALRPGQTRDFSDWLGLGLVLGLVRAFLTGPTGWMAPEVAVLAWLAALVCSYDRGIARGYFALLLAAAALGLAGPAELAGPQPAAPKSQPLA